MELRRPPRLPEPIARGGPALGAAVRWRLDSDDAFDMSAELRAGLLALAVAPEARRLRELIVEMREPLFDREAAGEAMRVAEGGGYIAGLNADQVRSEREARALRMGQHYGSRMANYALG